MSALVRLHVDTDRSATGRFLSYLGLFMAARRSADQLSRLPELTPDQLFGVRETTTDRARRSGVPVLPPPLPRRRPRRPLPQR